MGGTGGLPTGEVARRLGVSPVTLRSWERRYGIGPAQRAEGHHRRWTAADIARLEAMCRLTAQGLPPAEAARAATGDLSPSVVALGPLTTARQATARRAPDRDSRAAAASPADIASPAGEHSRAGDGSRDDQAERRRHARGLIRAADRLDAPALQELLDSALDRWGVEGAWEDVVAPTLRAAGRRWAALGEAYVEVEHLLSWHVATELRRRVAAVPRSGPVALLAATPGEEHTLPLDAVAAALTARGVAFRMLGASVPPLALAQAYRRLGPAAVLLWSQSRATAAPQLAADLLALPFGVAGARHGSLLLLGGPGWRSLGGPRTARRPPSLRAALDDITAAVDRS
ncbi:MerR family transcriptional regulator [Streptacidiphilus jiangxiensis]|uniref:B12 binding domain-containing protein n=1 Tax=Streptacidiphilus jiangxiensis TaxID=235985 RepID=A0A1H7N565_STRJI|nr:MerR family transcriptional regulator [Streptacidiphilus jiangxiensis]SEL18095.1 B12 binding domain-containing protein [Streptacidiphilus jiangxiensis]